MNVITPMQRPGARSLPAELMIPRQYRKVDWGRQRLLAGGVDRMQSNGGVRGLQGVGDVMCPDGSTQPTLTDCVYQGDWGSNVDLSSGSPVYTVPANDPGINWAAMAGIITAASTSMAKILAIQNPGTYYKDPQGNIIYAQPTGNTQNLPGIYGSGTGGGGAQGSFTTPIGSGSFGGINMGMVAVIGVGLMLMMSMGRR